MQKHRMIRHIIYVNITMSDFSASIVEGLRVILILLKTFKIRIRIYQNEIEKEFHWIPCFWVGH